MNENERNLLAHAVWTPNAQPSPRDAWRTQGLLWLVAGALAGAGLAGLTDGLPVVWGFFGSVFGAALAVVVRFFRLRR